jgi:spore maturation protein CgeB
LTIALFYHSALSDWNHGNAHFLRGIATELLERGHDVTIYEPYGAWSAANLVSDRGEAALQATLAAYPALRVRRYDDGFDLEEALDGAGLVLVHEWNSHDLVARIGRHRVRAGSRFTLLFHDTHHRSISDPASMARYDLSCYDGVLAFGEVIRQRYLGLGWADRAWTWHEAADTRVFGPAEASHEWELAWVGNWGDGERGEELREFLVESALALGLRTLVHGVRYPAGAIAALQRAGVEYRGWLPNYEVPRLFASARVTVHVPRRPYVRMLPGIPTIRPFEAMACGIPLVSAPWQDAEGLFRPGRDYLVARTGREMTTQLRDVLCDAALASELAASGLDTIRARHTCAHRVDELLAVVNSLRGDAGAAAATAALEVR